MILFYFLPDRLFDHYNSAPSLYFIFKVLRYSFKLLQLYLVQKFTSLTFLDYNLLENIFNSAVYNTCQKLGKA